MGSMGSSDLGCRGIVAGRFTDGSTRRAPAPGIQLPLLRGRQHPLCTRSLEI